MPIPTPDDGGTFLTKKSEPAAGLSSRMPPTTACRNATRQIFRSVVGVEGDNFYF